MKSMFLVIGEMYIKSSYLENTPIHRIEYKNPSNFLDLNDIYLGPLVMAELHKADHKSNKDMFRKHCLNFLVELEDQIYFRFPFDSQDMRGLECVDFINPNKLKQTNSIAPAACFYEKKS